MELQTKRVAKKKTKPYLLPLPPSKKRPVHVLHATSSSGKKQSRSRKKTKKKLVWECNLEDWNSKALLGQSTSTLDICVQNFWISMHRIIKGAATTNDDHITVEFRHTLKLKFNLNYNLILFNKKFENPFPSPKKKIIKIKIKMPPRNKPQNAKNHISHQIFF